MSNEVLTAEKITALLAGSRQRGGHEKYLRRFLESGEMYWTVSEAPEYSEKVKANIVSVKNTLTMKAKSLEFGNIRLVKVDDETLIIVNTEVLEASQAEAA